MHLRQRAPSGREIAKASRTLSLAEAGTGVGKTLGYIAPASVWAEKNEAPVWLSTYTRNLQHQIDQELDRLYPDPIVKARRVVVRKGRENYLCLLEHGRSPARRRGPPTGCGCARIDGALGRAPETEIYQAVTFHPG